MSTYLMGALIVSVVGALLLLFADFSGAYWNDGYTEGWVTITAWNSMPGAALVLPVGLFFLVLSSFAAQAMRNPAQLTMQRLRKSANLATAATVWVFIDGVIFAAIGISEDWDWWLEAGFYGGAIGGILAIILFRMAITQARASGVPEGTAPAPYSLPPWTSPAAPGSMPPPQGYAAPQAPLAYAHPLQTPPPQAPPPQAPPQQWPQPPAPPPPPVGEGDDGAGQG